MKTVLYRPVFINPQAYYVFPQLATLEPKTTDFIEPAIFTGKLVVQFDDSLEYVALYELILFNRTLTPEEQQIVLQQILECDVCKYTYTAKDATVHVFREGVRELTTDDYIYPGETLYVTARVAEGYIEVYVLYV